MRSAPFAASFGMAFVFVCSRLQEWMRMFAERIYTYCAIAAIVERSCVYIGSVDMSAHICIRVVYISSSIEFDVHK